MRNFLFVFLFICVSVDLFVLSFPLLRKGTMVSPLSRQVQVEKRRKLLN